MSTHAQEEFRNIDLAYVYEAILAIGGAPPTGGATSALQNSQQTTLLNILTQLGTLNGKDFSTATKQDAAKAVIDAIKVDTGNSLINLNELNVRVQALRERTQNLADDILTKAEEGFTNIGDARADFATWLTGNVIDIIFFQYVIIPAAGADTKYGYALLYKNV